MADLKEFSRENLLAVGFDFNQSFQVTLFNDSVVECHEVLRIMPGKRLVAFANWNNKPVVLKLLFGPRAKEQFERECEGVKNLIKNNVPTPMLYYFDHAKDKKIYALIFERIYDAQSADKFYQSTFDKQLALSVTEALVTELATQHALGIAQHDLHMKNFLVNMNHIYTLDGADIEANPEPLSRKISMDSLSLFFSQLNISLDIYREKFFIVYANLRGWLLKDSDIKSLNESVDKWRAYRWRRYKRKIFRNSSQFVRIANWHSLVMYDRQIMSTDFENFLKNPDALFSHPDSVILKDGRSATVAKIILDGQFWVVKRFNMKNVWHHMRRCLRNTRARRAWYLAQKLGFFGIPTALPMAFIEKRLFGLRGTSYLITQFVPGSRGDDYFKQLSTSSEEMPLLIERLMDLIVTLARLKMTHGDLKLTNIFINEAGYPVLIDLDGMKEHKGLFSLRKSLHKEIGRLLKNFQHQPEIQALFMRLFAQ